jgi:type I restriction enzyme M protein
MTNFGDKVSFIWSVADLLRGPYRPNQYKDVMLPMTVLRRLDCVLEPTKDKVLKRLAALEGGKIKEFEGILGRLTRVPFYNRSNYTFERLKGEPDKIAANLTHFIQGFSVRAREIFERFGFEEQIAKLDKADRLFLLVSKFCEIDLHPDVVSNIEMGYIFEELIRRFNEASNEEAGDHFTPREVIRLMVNLLFLPDGALLTTKGIVKTLYDPACGTGGMLSVAEEYLRELNPDASLTVFGQDYNDQAYAICSSDMLIKGHEVGSIYFGDCFTDDHFPTEKFDYMLANPPFGVKWEAQADAIKDECEQEGFGGRFGPGLPRINDGSLLFLLHMISKRKDPQEGGTRLAIVFNGSPLFTGSAASGESEIRRWILENDWLEGIVALPDQLFYNTGISTYLWIVTNRKSKERRGTVQLVDATSFYKKMRRSLGNKRHEICEPQRDEITQLYGEFREGEHVRIFANEDFGFHRITVERPLRLNFAITDELLAALQAEPAFASLATSKKRKDTKAAAAEVAEGKAQQVDILAALKSLCGREVVKNRDTFLKMLRTAFKNSEVKVPSALLTRILAALSERDETADDCTDSQGNTEPDPTLRDYENVPLREDIDAYTQREVLPYVPDAWVDETKTKVGYEISFNRYFYTYTPPRPLAEIEAELRQIEREVAEMLGGMAEWLGPRVEWGRVMSGVAFTPGDREVPWRYIASDTWPLTPIKYICSINGRSLSESTDPATEFRYLDIGSVDSEGNWTASDLMRFEDAPSRARRIVNTGDVLVSTVRTYLRAITHIENVDAPLICSTGFAVLGAKATLNPKFLAYWTRSAYFINEVVARSTGVSYPAVNASEIGNIPCPQLPIDQQRTIVDFLDRETAKIDALIDKKRHQIELLLEKRTSLITHAVIHGLDPGAPT